MDPVLEHMKARKAELLAELKKIRAAEKAYKAASSDASADSADSSVRKRKTTIKQEIMEILEDCPSGLDANGILEELQRRYRPGIERSTMSPQISRLHRERQIQQHDGRWFTAEHAAKYIFGNTPAVIDFLTETAKDDGGADPDWLD